MIYCVEIFAVYEDTAVPTNPRINQRNTDFNSAVTQANALSKAVDPQANEYLERWGRPTDEVPVSRYGTLGWRGRQWLVVQQDAVNLGTTIWGVLSGRNLKDGSKVEVFSRDETQPGYVVTRDPAFRRALPAGVWDVG